MLRIGLTGGIGAGKSTVSTMLAAHGAVIVDADAIAREVVAPGEPLLDELSAAFGPEVIAADGGLDRAALAAAAFVDEERTAALNALMHPAIRDRTAEHFARSSEAEIVVHDVALLVENDMGPAHHLNLLVDVPAEIRLHRLVDSRGMDRADAEARISRQATDEARRAACDVIIDNSGSREGTRTQVDRLLDDRLHPFAANLAAGRPAERGPVELVAPDIAARSAAAERIIAKLRYGTEDAFTIEHIGSTAVPGLIAEDIIDLQLLVPEFAAAEALAPRLAELGYPGRELADRLGERGCEPERLHANTDPGRAVNLHVRAADSCAAAFARAFRDLLRDDPGERERYARIKQEAAKACSGDESAGNDAYAEAKEAYFESMRRRLVPGSFL